MMHKISQNKWMGYMVFISKLKRLLMMGAFYMIPLLSIAAEEQKAPEQLVGLGLVAKNLLEPVSLMADLVHTACFVIGGAFLFTCVIKYFEHRKSPLMVPISTVIFLLIAGNILILLPFISYITDNGIHYSLMRG